MAEPDPPPRPSSPVHHGRRRTDSSSGWTPEHERDDLEATAWRARRALEATEAHAGALAKLGAAVDANSTATNNLSHVFELGATAAEARWQTAGKLAKWAAALLGAPALLAIGRFVVLWIVGLHH